MKKSLVLVAIFMLSPSAMANLNKNDPWFGYSLHHRSSIFETSSAFGRIKGGSNYNTLYLQYHW